MDTTPTKQTEESNQDNSHEHKAKHTLYHFFGLVCILMAIIPVLWLTPELYGRHFESFAERNDAFQSILVVPAFFATMAGILFVVDNLKMQRNTLLVQIDANKMQQKELKLQIDEQITSNKHFHEQNQALLNQQADNTFFNLITLYKNRIDEINTDSFFSQQKNRIIYGYKDYIIQLDEGRFDNFKMTEYNPNCYFIHKSGIDHEKYSSLATGAKDIIDFIEEKLNDQAGFYHRIFYNQLQKEVKFFLGFFIEFGMYGLRSINSFQYSQAYFLELIFYSGSKSFPALSMEIKPASYLLKSMNEYSITAYLNLLTLQADTLILDRVLLEIQDSNLSGIWSIIIQGNGKEIKPYFQLDIKEAFRHIAEMEQTASMYIRMNWQFTFKGETFYVERKTPVHYLKDDKIVVK